MDMTHFTWKDIIEKIQWDAKEYKEKRSNSNLRKNKTKQEQNVEVAANERKEEVSSMALYFQFLF